MIKITLGIDGMMCSHCEAHMNDAIRNNLTVRSVESSHSKKQTVIMTETDIADDKLYEVVAPTGYKILSISREEAKKKGLFSFFKK